MVMSNGEVFGYGASGPGASSGIRSAVPTPPLTRSVPTLPYCVSGFRRQMKAGTSKSSWGIAEVSCVLAVSAVHCLHGRNPDTSGQASRPMRLRSFVARGAAPRCSFYIWQVGNAEAASRIPPRMSAIFLIFNRSAS
jgi:hypothetical protein